ncbi:sulfotransferase, putative [Entamoeba histolytica KU27]|uniref:Sulfotransferase, putative n=1 Tax=Entamoeba histolytica KU27 TaxID=885311 RepID=M2RAT8_ENTHI|nr:sulfotransferase, putative [Entamoeba histolytica KU27]
MLHSNPYHYEIHKENKYGLPLLPKENFEAIFTELGKQSIGLLCQLDPTHAELYQKEIPSLIPTVPQQFIDSMHELLAGCFDQQSELFKMMTRNVVAKYSACLRFLLEKKLYQKELDNTSMLPTLFVVALPRSGSTFTHTLLSADPQAETMCLYEHLSPGGKTMIDPSRRAFGNQIIATVQKNSEGLNGVHAFVNAERPEEELFFLEQMGHSYLFPNSVPRLEVYRKSMFERDFHFAYEYLKDHLKMHQLEFNVDQSKHYVMKGVSHFVSFAPMLDVFGKLEDKNYFIWIHREPVDELKSDAILEHETQGWYENDIGLDDKQWICDNLVEANLLNLKNAIAIRESWIKENPKRAERIIDIGFKEVISDPIGVMKRIYQKVGMEFTREVETKINEAIVNDIQKKFSKKVDQSLWLFNEAEIREKFKWYYEKFGQYMPNYWGEK